MTLEEYFIRSQCEYDKEFEKKMLKKYGSIQKAIEYLESTEVLLTLAEQMYEKATDVLEI